MCIWVYLTVRKSWRLQFLTISLFILMRNCTSFGKHTGKYKKEISIIFTLRIIYFKTKFNLKFLFEMQVDFVWRNSNSLCLYTKGKHITQQMCLYVPEGQIYELTVHEINLDDLCWSRPQDNLHIFHYLNLPSRLITGLRWYQFLTCMID